MLDGNPANGRAVERDAAAVRESRWHPNRHVAAFECVCGLSGLVSVVLVLLVGVAAFSIL